ncbi:NAD-dependent epimerase/dehydratase family protein [Brevibacillus nitrificans]|uniref:NAD-dependent epimerase/dehydratase family protein n=1 Tax=Brevibacillus nitrificans TaxID=651560 RepID=UPI00262B34A8|nr:NAD-dependent epimerase/dehydratase family protein [Brevibacillus nitrificans]
MKVLVTGGYGFIGSFVAERFYKEGYQVYILDNLSSGNQHNVDFKHKSFLFSVEDKKCEEVFRSNKFDVVVHLAAQINVQTSMEDPLLDSTSNILGLVNMLRLSSKHRVEKFIFASSAAVYGRNEHVPLSEEDKCDPISIYGMNKLIGEQYCHKWKEFYGLDTLCFRFANVYGPRQGSIGEGGVISTFLERLHTDQEIDLHGDGSQTRDFIYVEDVADAIYRAGTTDYSGVLNLSTNKQSSINELIGLLGEEKTLKGINHSPKRKGDIDVSVLDNTRVKRRLDWVPMYSLREGLAKTSRWFAADGLQRENEKRARAAETDTARPSFVADIRPYVENLLAFLVVLALSVYTTQSGMFDLELIYIVLISAIYGTKQSILAVILSCGLFIGESLHNGREIVSLLYDASVLFHIAIYFIIGIAVGYSMDKRSKEVVSTQFEKQAVEEKYDFLKEMYNDNLQVKDELQQQIVNSEESFGKMYAITKELDSLEPERVLQSAVHVLEKIMKSDEISIYTMNQNNTFLRLVAKSNKTGFDLPRSLKVSDHSYLTSLMHTQKIYVEAHMREDRPILAAPILDNGKMVAMVAIQHLGFEHFTLYTQNLFQVAVQLISAALSRSLRHMNSTYKDRYIGETSILRPPYFYEMVKSKREAKQRLNTDFTILSVDRAGVEYEAISPKIAGSLREADYIGIDEAGELFIILSNSNELEAAFVVERLKRKGIAAWIVTERDRPLLTLKDGAYV